MSNDRVWAVVPVKDIKDAKQRLASVLVPHERAALFRAMLHDVLSALSAAKGLAGIVLVTRDPEAIELARQYGASVLLERANQGQTAAVSAGAQALAQQGVAGMIAVPADVPLISASDVEQLLDAHGCAPAVTITPARDRLGSNAVICSPPPLLPLAFGANSFYPHVESARHQGVEPRVVDSAPFALDIDRPADLQVFIELASATRAQRYLQQSGIAARLRTRSHRISA
jgi:2-phospho-L-lactate/phosphoenolpyruvate guanylyltransferase